MKAEINYLQIKELSDKEQFEMYMRCKKKALARMLIERGKPIGKITTVGNDLKFVRFIEGKERRNNL